MTLLDPQSAVAAVDVVVVTYQSAKQLASCLGSVPDDCRITVVDNASNDGSAALAEKLGATVIRNERNEGFGAAAGQGASAGDRQFVLFLNPDARLADGALAALIAAFEDRPLLGIAGPRLHSPTGSAQRAWWPFPSAGRTWLEAFGLHRLTRDSAGLGQAVPFVVGACMVVRRQVFEELGGFDSAFWLYGEEADLCRRAWDSGWEVRFVPDASAVHVGGASGASDQGLVFEHFSRGTERFILKHQGRGALVAHRVGLLIGSLVRLGPLRLRATPDGVSRFNLRRRVALRTARALVTHPTRVSSR